MKIIKYLLTACLMFSLISVIGCSTETNESSALESSMEDKTYPNEIQCGKDMAASTYFPIEGEQAKSFVDALNKCSYTRIDEPKESAFVTAYQIKLYYNDELVWFALDPEYKFVFIYGQQQYYSIEGFSTELGNEIFSILK